MSAVVDERQGVPTFSLVGGPVHRFGRRIGRFAGLAGPFLLALALGGFLWVVMVVLALIDGRGAELLSLADIGAHTRLLVALPLFSLCESMVDPRLGTFVETIVRSGTVPAGSLSRLAAESARVRGWAGGWLVDVGCMAVAVIMLLVGSQLSLPWGPGAAAVGATPTLSDFWYSGVCMTVFRFVLFRWIVRLALWTYFLWRLTRMGLVLAPSHPDRSGGLGYLEVVHMHFLPLIFAFSAVEAASFAEGIASGQLAFESTYPIFATALAIDLLVFVGPLLIFAPSLWRCRVKGLSDYSVLGSSYVTGFDRKWVQPGATPGEPLLGTADLQSLADLGNSSGVVREMRVVPFSLILVRDLAIAALLPMLPLLLLKYPLAELVKLFVGRLSGM